MRVHSVTNWGIGIGMILWSFNTVRMEPLFSYEHAFCKCVSSFGNASWLAPKDQCRKTQNAPNVKTPPQKQTQTTTAPTPAISIQNHVEEAPGFLYTISTHTFTIPLVIIVIFTRKRTRKHMLNLLGTSPYPSYGRVKSSSQLPLKGICDHSLEAKSISFVLGPESGRETHRKNSPLKPLRSSCMKLYSDLPPSNEGFVECDMKPVKP